MDDQAPRGLLRAFAGLKDPRVNRTRRHLLDDIIFLAICGVICGADAWTEIVDFGRVRIKWLKSFLRLPNGIPSHDTFGRVFAKLDPVAFEACFMQWAAQLSQSSAGRLVAIDGKAIRRSMDSAADKAAIHMISAWCGANQMVLAQLATQGKGNEITAIPELLKLLDIKGAVVTIDAAGCQKKIVRQIVDQGGDYVLGLKGNQGTLHKETQTLFDQCMTDDCRGIAYSTATTIDKDHGRIEERQIWATSDIEWFAEKNKWKNLRSLIRVRRKRTIGEKTSDEYHYYISSLPADNASKLMEYVRGHWGVENNLHWCLDISFADDQRRARKGNTAENFARLGRIALNLLKLQIKHKAGLKRKRKCCGWDPQYMLNVLTQEQNEL
jgi:predicted transposase YbfD/YdcC